MTFYSGHQDLFNTRTAKPVYIEPWKPQPLGHDQWADRDYRAVYAWRIQQLAWLQADPERVIGAKAYYSTRPAEFIMHWMDTYDPRKSPTHQKEELRGPKRMPFVFFMRQVDVIDFLHEMRETGESGLFEKARDMGLTWLCCAYSVWSWLFIDGDAIGWGSRKQELVDKIGDMSSIFEKLRFLIRGLPAVFKPKGLKERDHLKSMNLVNPDNGSAIIGEIGNNIGRGGRTSMYFKDEAAHYEKPELVQAALDDNTHVQIDISSVNGLGNVFHRRRQAGIEWKRGHNIPSGYVRVMVIDWRDHPEKTQEWYDQRKAANIRVGTQHLFAQEVDRNYAASLGNNIIDAEWIAAAVDAHLRIPVLRIPPPNLWMAGQDVADEGLDRNALALRQWIILRSVEQWGERDVGVTTRRMVAALRHHRGIKVQYDSIGVGAGVKAEYNRLLTDGLITRDQCNLIPWNAGAKVVDPAFRVVPGDDQSLTNADFFGNFKAQAWWRLRERFYKTWVIITAIEAGKPIPNYEADELISLDSVGLGENLYLLMQELAQPQKATSSGLRMIVDKKPDGVASPNLADAVVMAYNPAPEFGTTAVIGAFS